MTNGGNLFTSPKAETPGWRTKEELQNNGYILFGETNHEFDDCPNDPEGDQSAAQVWRLKCAKRIKMIQNGNDDYHLAKSALKERKDRTNAKISGLRNKARRLLCHNYFDALHTQFGLDDRTSRDHHDGGGGKYLDFLLKKTKDIETKSEPFMAQIEEYFENNPIAETMDEAFESLFKFAEEKVKEVDVEIWAHDIYNYSCCNDVDFPDAPPVLRDVLIHLKHHCNYNSTAFGRQKWGLQEDGIHRTLERLGFKIFRSRRMGATKGNIVIQWEYWTDGSLDYLSVRVTSPDAWTRV